MNAVVGVVAIIAGVAVIVPTPRMMRANEASSAVLFGRFDPYTRWPRFSRAWALTIGRVVGGMWVAFGLLAIVGVVDLI